MEDAGQQERGFRPTLFETPRIKEIFGKESKIKKIENGYRVNTVLSDGVVEGGQIVEVDLLSPSKSSKVEVDLLSPSKSSKDVGSTKTMKLTSLKVNGVNISSFFMETHFEIRPLVVSTEGSMSIVELEVLRKDHKLLRQIDKQTGSFRSNAKIVMTSFNSSDDLAALFHEQGHANDPMIDTKEYHRNRRRFHTLESKGPSRIKESSMDKPEIISTWKAVLKQEVDANRQARDLVRKISKKVSLFPTDEKFGFQRLKKLQETFLLSYLESSGGWYKDHLTNKELSELMKV